MHVGLIGGGYWGSKHLRVLAGLEDVDRVTLIELDPARRKSLVGSFPSVDAVDDLDAVLGDLDAVVVATKPETHLPLGRKILEAGKHVLIEKPLVTTLSGAAELCALAEQQGLVLMTGHTFEFNPVVDEVKSLIGSGVLGDIHYIRSLRLNLGLYQSDVNVVWDLAPHDVSIINYLLNEAPARVTAWGRRSSNSVDLEDVAMLRLEYDQSGVEAYVHVSWLDPSKVRELTVVGDRKMVVYDDVRSQEQLRIFDRGVEVDQHLGPQNPLSYRYGDITSPYIAAREPLMLEDRHFIDSIRRGYAERADGRSGLQVVAVMEAAQRSLAEQRPVELAEVYQAAGVPVAVEAAAGSTPMVTDS